MEAWCSFLHICTQFRKKAFFTTHSHTGQSKRTIYSTDTTLVDVSTRLKKVLTPKLFLNNKTPTQFVSVEYIALFHYAHNLWKVSRLCTLSSDTKLFKHWTEDVVFRQKDSSRLCPFHFCVGCLLTHLLTLSRICFTLSLEYFTLWNIHFEPHLH